MNSKKITRVLIPLLCLLVLNTITSAMPLKMSREDMIRFTPEWKGERFANGRPKVSDSIIERMRSVDIEAAWVVLKNEGYDYQFEDGWTHVHPGETLCGRAMTVQYMPLRKAMNEVTNEQAKKDGRVGGQGCLVRR